MEKFTSVGSYITESGIGREKVFVVENNKDRNPKLEKQAFPDLLGHEVEIDGVVRKVINIRSSKSSFVELNFKKGELIGLDVI